LGVQLSYCVFVVTFCLERARDEGEGEERSRQLHPAL
jgi:hypothetical protein